MSDSKLRLTAPKPSSHPVDVGLRSEAAVCLELLRRGYSFSVPSGVNQRYDLILDIDGDLLKVQCKTGRLKNGVISFPTQSVRASMSGVFTRDYVGEADLFLVYCPENSRVFAVPVDVAPRTRMCLRVDRSLNGQSQRVNWAETYALPG